MILVSKSDTVMEKRSGLRNPALRVIAVWGWKGICMLALMGISSALGFGFAISRELRTLPWLMLASEAIGVGLAPLLISFASRDEWSEYGFTKKGLLKSLAYSAVFFAFMVLLGLAFGQARLPSPPRFTLDFPLNLLFVILATAAWGPLEVFFVIWLIVNTQRLFKSTDRMFTSGMVVTIVVFGALHLVTATGGIVNAASVAVLFLVLGLIFNSTKNAIGPMIAWTLMNRQVWSFWQLLFM